MTTPPAIPFMPSKDLPPFHLRPWTPSELEQARRMLRAQERLRRGPAPTREQGRK
jgi:hypothetical protein